MYPKAMDKNRSEAGISFTHEVVEFYALHMIDVDVVHTREYWEHRVGSFSRAQSRTLSIACWCEAIDRSENYIKASVKVGRASDPQLKNTSSPIEAS